MPGPACYGRGGAEPTVTDANLLLGRLDAGWFLGGEMPLVPKAAHDVLTERVAQPLGYAGEDAAVRAAKGVLTIANLTMTSIIKKISVARGYDPRDFALFCYGGGGPLHGTELARALRIPRVIVPSEPGNFSAVGMLLADPRIDTARTYVARLNPESMATALEFYGGLEAEGRAALLKEFGTGEITFQREAELRYKGQHHSIKLVLPPDTDATSLRAMFDQEYLRRYGHENRTADVEMVVLHSLATLHMARPEVSRLAGHGHSVPVRETTSRPVFFLEDDRFLDTQIYDRYGLDAGFAGRGPALVVEYGSSTLIGPRDEFKIGQLGEIDIDCSR
jgi:N-methylhydantoinase A